MTNYLNRLVSRALPNPAVRTMTPSVAREAVAAVDDPFAAAPIVDEPGRAVAATRRAVPVSLASPAAVSRVTPLMSAPPPDAPPRREAAALVPVIAPPTIAAVPSGAPRDQPAAAWPSDASRERAPSPAASWTRLESSKKGYWHQSTA